MLFLRIKQAEIALADGRLDEAYEIAKAADLRRQRSGQDLIGRLARALLKRGRDHLLADRPLVAAHDCEKAEQLAGNLPELAQLRAAVAAVLEAGHESQQRCAQLLAAARRQFERGQLTLGQQILARNQHRNGEAVMLADMAENQRAVVEPGLVNVWLTNALAPRGYYYSPDPASQTACSIGGNVAENSGGPRTPKYGVTTNHVLGLEVVLPDGDIVNFGGRTLDPLGYDLTGIFVGSEGTFGIATKVTVRIMRTPEAVKTLMGVFETIEDESNTVSEIVGQGIVPAAIEMMDNNSIQAVEKGVAAGYPLDAVAVLLVEVDGPKEEVEALVGPIIEVCKANHVREVRVAKDENERLLLWKGRKAAFAAMGQISPEYYVQDSVIPRTKLPPVMKLIGELSQKYGLRVANVFHAGDGNLHPLILYNSANEGELRKAEEMGAEIVKAAASSGRPLKEVALEMGVDEETYEKAMDLRKMAQGNL